MLSGIGAARSLAHSADGALLSAVSASTFAVIRLDASGALDPSFGVAGLATIDIRAGSLSYATQLLVQPDHVIVVVGVVGAADGGEQQDIAVARLTETGQLDPSFGENGLTIAHFATGISVASAAALAPDGSIVVAGATPRGNGMSSFSVVRFTKTGALDSSFGEAGRKLLSDGGLAQVIAVDADARAVVAGWIANRQCVVYRLWL
jgi:uncharacterized delta-60 repeat protein